jgi:hypothetical protein
MAYTLSQIISFILFIILICLAVLLVAISATAKNSNGGGMFSSLKSMASSAANSASDAAKSAMQTAKDTAINKAFQGVLLLNQINKSPKEYLEDLKLVYNDDKFQAYLTDTISKANARIAANTGIKNEYERRDKLPEYVKEKGSYQGFIKKCDEDNDFMKLIIKDCETLKATKLMSDLNTAISPIIDPEINKMDAKKSLVNIV